MAQGSLGGHVYRRFGARPIINAAGTVTRLGGSRTRPEALSAMAEATNHMVDMHELNQRAGEVIAQVTGAEAGFVCNGAASGLLLQAAAVIAGTPTPPSPSSCPTPSASPTKLSSRPSTASPTTRPTGPPGPSWSPSAPVGVAPPGNWRLPSTSAPPPSPTSSPPSSPAVV